MFNLPKQTHYLPATKEYMLKFIGPERLERNSEFVERTAHRMVTESDFKAFMQLMVDVYESAYLKAVEDYREQFQKQGIEVKIGTELR